MFILFSAAAALAASSASLSDRPEPAAGSPSMIVCKRFLEQGSLLKTYRTCKTKREWERERDNIRVFEVINSTQS